MCKRIYCDHAATAFPKAPGVADAMVEELTQIGANVGRGSYHSAQLAEELMLDTREQLASFFHFDEPSRVIFTPGQTQSINQMLFGLLKPGDHVIIDPFAHNAVMRPLAFLEQRGIHYSLLPAESNGTVSPEQLDCLIRENTRLAVFTHASNVSGLILPLEALCAICKRRDVPVMVDAAQTAGHVAIDMGRLGIDALCAPGHKGLLGPEGIGALLLSERLASAIDPLIFGGTGSRSDRLEQPSFFPDRLEAGTPNLPGIAGLHAALNFLQNTGVEALGSQSLQLAKRFMLGIKTIPGIRIIGTEAAERVAVVSFTIDGIDSATLADRLDQDYGIAVRCGLHCAPIAHKTLGTFPEGTVRFSFGYGSTDEDVDQAIRALTLLSQER